MAVLPGNPDTARLDDFAPPSSYRFEPELQETSPRHIPEEFRNSPYFARQRKTSVGLIVGGLLCVAFGQSGIVKEWGLYVLPLAYLSWIGCGLLVFGAVAWLSSKSRRGPLQYVEEGVPIVTRILELVLRPTAVINGQASTYAFSATVQYRDPDSGALMAKQLDSRSFSSSAKHNYRTSYRVGDYVTAVYLKSNPGKTLRLYGFLELRPDMGLLRTQDAPPPGLLKTALGVSALFGCFFILFWNVYAFSKYEPLDIAFAQVAVPVGAGALVLGGGLLTWLGLRQARARRETAARNEKALAAGEAVELETRKRGLFGAHGLLLTLVIAAGSLLIGGVTVLCWCFTANALLDTSKPEFRPVQIVEFWSTTHNFLFREYEIEYHLEGETKTRKLLSTPAQMRQFRFRQATAEMHAGRFGWLWVKTIGPVRASGATEK